MSYKLLHFIHYKWTLLSYEGNWIWQMGKEVELSWNKLRVTHGDQFFDFLQRTYVEWLIIITQCINTVYWPLWSYYSLILYYILLQIYILHLLIIFISTSEDEGLHRIPAQPVTSHPHDYFPDWPCVSSVIKNDTSITITGSYNNKSKFHY